MPVLTDLTVKQPEIASPIQTIGALQQIKSAQIENALRQQQMQTNAAMQQNVQAEADQRNRDLADQNTVQDLQKDPSVNARLHTGDFSDLNGKVQPKTLDAFRKQQQDYMAGLQTQTVNTTKIRTEALGEIANTVAGLKTLTDGQGKPDLARINAALPGAMQALKANGVLRNAGIQSDPPLSISNADDLDMWASQVGAALAAHEKVLADKKTTQEIDTSAATAGKDTAAANLDNFKLSLMKGLTGPNVAASVDSLIDRTKYPQANADAHAAAQLAANSGDPAKVTEAVQKIYDEQVGSVQKATALIPSKVAEQKALIPGEVSKAAQIESAKVPIEISKAVKTQAALAANSPEMFAGINDPASRRTAQADYQKQTEAYLDKAQSAQQLKDFIGAAQSGNKAAPGLIPLSELRSVVNRVNRSELDAVSKGAGSVVDKVQGWFNGATEGQPVPPDILQGMGKIADIENSNSRSVYVNKVNALGATYGGHVKPVDVPGTTPAKAAPAVGTVDQGYRFKGGNPGDPASWEKVAP